MLTIAFDNSYARLPDRFHVRLAPAPVTAPHLITLNRPLTEQLGLDPDALTSDAGVAALAGNVVPDGAEPLAMAYAGHQFGHFVPQLGDGRAILLGEIIGRDGIRRDVQLKGAGRTPFSRQGDGRAALGPVLREYLVSEAFAALGIPATRALAALTTGDEIWRDMPLPGAILVRVASSHLRVGTFQYFAARGDWDAVRILADYAIARHVPDAADTPERYRALLDEVVQRHAELVAAWLSLGFIHGVMNTDNMSISGETIDFGPCAFLDNYDPGKVFSSIDRDGRYAFSNQPSMALWNLARFAECLLPLLGNDEATQLEGANSALDRFASCFEAAYTQRLRAKLGLMTTEPDDLDLARDLLRHMAEGSADFTNTFRALCEAADDPAAEETVRAQFATPLVDSWLVRWRARLAAEGGDGATRAAAMRGVNPAFIPRNHRIEQVIMAAYRGDFAPFHRLHKILGAPYHDQPEHSAYAAPPAPEEAITRTFCGT